MRSTLSGETLKLVLRNWFYKTSTYFFGDEKGYAKLPVLTGPAKGLCFNLNLSSKSEGAFLIGRYEIEVVRRLFALCQKGWNVWDCGTYLGYYTLLFARKVGSTGKVVAFEPDPINYLRTVENARLNDFENVRVLEMAVGEPIGELTFVSTKNRTSHLVGTYVGGTELKDTEKPEVQSLIKVSCQSLDQIFQMPETPRPHLIKLDLEGAEVKALSFAGAIVQECRPFLAVELHNPECDEALWHFAQRHGYSLSSLQTGKTISSRSGVGGFVLASP